MCARGQAHPRSEHSPTRKSLNCPAKATILSGIELNQATRSFNYNAPSTYVIIFWDKNEASIIEMQMPFLSVVGEQGTDQRGISWEIAKSSICI